MRSSMYIALFASMAAAQSSVTLLNLFQGQSTLTQIGSDAAATTYKNVCPSNSAGLSAAPRPTPSASNATSTLQLSAPSITGKARLARQAVATPSGTGYDPNYSFCEPYTLKQGPSTWEFHLTDPTPGAWTIDMDCKGMIASGDLVCTETQSGYVVGSAGLGVRTTSLGNAEILSLGALQTVAVVMASGAPSAAASQTGSPSPASPKSTGLAPARSLPTGVVIVAGGIFAAAIGL